MYPENGISGLKITLNGVVCCDPTPLMEYHQRNGIPYDHFYGKANSFTLPRGKEYGRGCVLMLWKDVEPLIAGNRGSPNTFNFTLKWEDAYGAVEIKKLGIVRVRHLTGIANTLVNEALCLVELADARYLGRYTSINKAYNFRSYRSIDDANMEAWYDSTLNGAATWTWTEIVQDIWALLPTTPFGALVDNGIYPAEVPENLIYRGVSAWDALISIMKVTQNWVYRDLDGNFRIESGQAEQTTGMEGDPQRQAIWNPTNDRGFGAIFPEKIRVLFPADKNDFQNDADTESIAGQDAYILNPLYTIDVTTTTLLTDIAVVPGTIATIHAPLAAHYHVDGTLLNGLDLTGVANSLAQAWAYAHDPGTHFSLHTIYHGFHQLLPGSQTEAVVWYSTGSGSKTEVLLSPLKYDPEDTVGTLGKTQAREIYASESMAPPDTARKHEQTERFAVARLLSDISCSGGFGTVSIRYGVASGTSYNWASSGKLVRAHNPANVNYKANSYVNILYHWQIRSWVILGPAANPLYRGVLASDMCGGDSATLDDYPYNLACCSDTFDALTAANPFALEGITGDDVLMTYDCDVGGLIVIQVKHHQLDIVRYPFTSVDGCEPELDAYGVPTGNTLPTGDCKITYKKRTVAVMSCDQNEVPYTLYSFSQIDVLTDVYQYGYQIRGLYVPIFVACICTPYDALLIQGTPCDYSTVYGYYPFTQTTQIQPEPAPYVDPAPQESLSGIPLPLRP